VSVDVEGDDGQVRHMLITGEPITVRIKYVAHQRIEEPVFGLAIHRQDGLHLIGPNTLDSGLEIDAVTGEGEILYRLEAAPMLSGKYELSVSCYDRSCTHPYDHHHRRYPLHVRAGSVRQRFGLLELPASWEHVPGQSRRDSPGSAPRRSGADVATSDDRSGATAPSEAGPQDETANDVAESPPDGG
jgi:lipopolysaccharide transport system ATP-binding protein